MPLLMEMRLRSSRNDFHAVGVLPSRLRFRLARKSVQTWRLTPAGKAHGLGVEALASIPLTVPDGLGADFAPLGYVFLHWCVSCTGADFAPLTSGNSACSCGWIV